MEVNIKKILMEFHLLSETNKKHKELISELTSYGFELKTANVLDGLDSSFVESVEPFIEQLKMNNCIGRFTSGKRQPLKNSKSYHITGQALDMTLPTDDCYCKAMDICTQFPNLFCLDERKNITQDWTGPHLHVSVPQKSGKTKPCSSKKTELLPSEINKSQSSNSTNNSVTSDNNFSNDLDTTEKDTGLADVARFFGKQLNLKQVQDQNQQMSLSESLDLGVNVIYNGVESIIPASVNKKIYSPVEGIVMKSSYVRNCQNPIKISVSNNKYTLVYCDVSKHSVVVNQKVNEGDELGKITQDVIVRVYNNVGKQISPDFVKIDTSQGKKNNSSSYEFDDDEDDDLNGKNTGIKYKPEKSYQDAALAALFRLPFTPFLDKKDKKTGKIQKNWASPTEKVQPEKSSLISKLFNSPTKKKVNEEIEKIKKLII